MRLSGVRPALGRLYSRSLGATGWGESFAWRVHQVEDRARGAVWRWSAPARRIEIVGTLLSWLADTTKRADPNVRLVPLGRFAPCGREETLRKIQEGQLSLPVVADPEVTIVVPAYNHFESTYACLEAIAAHTEGPSHEVVVVDDCSSDVTADMLRSVGGVRAVRNERNLGFIGACNAGAAVARGRFLVFLNNDTEVCPGWLEALRRTFDDEPRAGLVGAKLVYPDGRLQEAGGIVWGNGAAWNYGRLGDPNAPQHQYLRRADYCSGACIMIPTALFRSLGGFDAHFAPAYYEDADLALRVRRAGHDVYYQPLSTVIHLEGVTAGKDVKSGVKRYQVENERKFAARWSAQVAGHGVYGERPDLEKDRGVRGRVLIVDAFTPEPDRDSGSLRMFNLMQVLRQLGFKVTFMPWGLAPAGAYTAALQGRGVEVLHRPYVWSERTYLRHEGERYDLIVFSRAEVATAFLPAARRALRRPRLVYDTVDLHHVREEREARVKGDADLLRKAAKRRTQELGLTLAADATLVVSPVEKTILERAVPGARVRVVSNILATRPCATPFAERSGLLFVGGFRHAPNVDAVRWYVAEILPRVRRAIPAVTLHVVGADPPAAVQRLAGKHVRVVGFVPEIEPYLAQCRLSVAPLRYGAGVKGKINTSLSHGLPVVATTIAVEGMDLRDGEDVLVADDPDAFAAQVVRLHQEEVLWQKLSHGGLQCAERSYSLGAARAAVETLVSELLPDLTPVADPGHGETTGPIAAS